MKSSDRARQMLEQSSAAQRVAGPHLPSGSAMIQFGLGCSMSGRAASDVTGMADGDTVRLLRCDPVPFTPGQPAGMPPSSLGSFRHFDASAWTGCYHCGARGNPGRGLAGPAWLCTGCGGLNCAGCDDWGIFRCACGITVSSFAPPLDRVEVRGTRSLPAVALRHTPPVASVLRPTPFVAPAPARVPPLPALQGPPPLRLPGRR